MTWHSLDFRLRRVSGREVGILSLGVLPHGPVRLGAYVWVGDLHGRWRVEVNLALFPVHLQLSWAGPLHA